jgi:hypothetical protein
VVDFSLAAYPQPKSRIYIHCAEAKHQSLMVLLAVLGVLGMKLTEVEALVQQAREFEKKLVGKKSGNLESRLRRNVAENYYLLRRAPLTIIAGEGGMESGHFRRLATLSYLSID